MRGGFWIWILILIRLYGKNYFLVYTGKHPNVAEYSLRGKRH